MFWFLYAMGYKSYNAAYENLMDEVSEGRLSLCDCKIESYRNKEGKRRYKIMELVS